MIHNLVLPLLFIISIKCYLKYFRIFNKYNINNEIDIQTIPWLINNNLHHLLPINLLQCQQLLYLFNKKYEFPISKIEILRVKICGHPNFSPQLYYKQIDRCEKGYIDTEDIVTFIKKSKPAFNVDHRYLKSLFIRLNQDDRVPSERLTYFGYLNIIKPYFDSVLARDILLRDTIALGTEINIVAKKLLQDLICTLYVCVAQHQRIKQLIIIGDIQQGGTQQGNLYNIHQMLQIIKQNSYQTTSLNTIPMNIHSQPNIRQNRNNISSRNINTQHNINNIPVHQQIRSTTSINPTNNYNSNAPNINMNQNIHSNTNTDNNSHHIINQNTGSRVSIQSSGLSRKSRDSILDIFHRFIINTTQYQIERTDMKFLLAYLMCHQYMIVQDKYLTLLFMPVSAIVSMPVQPISTKNQKQKHYYQNQHTVSSAKTNFLGFVHKNSVTRQGMQQQRKRRQQLYRRRAPLPNHNPQIKHSRHNNLQSSSKLIDQQPRILINAPKNNLQTPILQKFLRQSKVLKNMSRYRQPIQQQSSITSQSSAFIMEGESERRKTTNKKQFLDPNPNVYNIQKPPINRDLSLHDMLQNSNMQRSQYYNNLSMRAYIKDQPLKPAQMISPKKAYDYDDNTSGILNNFMRK